MRSRKSAHLASFMWALAILLLVAPAVHAGLYSGWDLRMVDTNQGPGNLTNTTAIGDSPIGGPYPGGFTVAADLTVHYSTPDWGTGGYGVNNPYPTGVNATDNFVLKATADVVIPPGTWTVGFGSDDGGLVRLVGVGAYGDFSSVYNINGTQVAEEVRFDAGRGHSWTGGTFTIPAGPSFATQMEVYQWENGGGDSLEIGMAAGTTTGTLPLLVDGLNGWSVTGNVVPTLPVGYRIQVGAPTNNATAILYVNDIDDVNLPGTQLASGTSGGGNQLTLTGTLPIRATGATDFIQIEGDWQGTGSQTTAPSLTAMFTAPLGYTFVESGNQYIRTDTATWAASTVRWGDFGYSHGDATTYQIPSPSPAPTGFVAGTQSIWGSINDFVTPLITPGYFDTAATLQPGAWTIFQEPEQGVNQPAGLSAHIVRVDNNLDNLGQVDTALALRKNDANHSVSAWQPISVADIDSAGNYGPPAGYLPGDHHDGGCDPEDYAMRVTAYVQTSAPNEVWTFAVSGDNRLYLNIGGIEFARSESVVGTPLLAQMNFPTAGFYPLELVWANRDGGTGAEISYASGFQTAWSAGSFSVLGTGALPVVQNPAALGDMTNVGANTVGGVLVPGAFPFAGDGFRVQQAYVGYNIAQLDAAVAYYGDKAIANGDMTQYNTVASGAVATATNLDFHDSGGTGNWGFNNPLPANTGGDDNYYAVRMNGLVYIPEPGTFAMTMGSDDSRQVRIGDQILGRYRDGGGIASGSANYLYGYVPQAGLYPFEFYMHEGNGGSGIELSYGGSTSLLLPSRNPATNGFTVDWSGIAFTAQPYAELRKSVGGSGLTIDMKAFTDVPALATQVRPEHWQLVEVGQRGAGARVPGLFAQLYDTSGNTTPDWREDWPVVSTQSWPANPNQVFQTGGRFGFPSPPAPSATDQIAARWTGYLYAPVGGLYNFRMDTDDRSWMFIDLDGDGVPEGAPGNDAWTVTWDNVPLLPGLHAVEFRAREFGGGEWSNLQWQMPNGAWNYIPSDYFSQNVYDGMIVATQLWGEGTGQVGDLLNWAEEYMAFDFDSTHDLRLVVDVAGLVAYADGAFTFIPEPGTMLLLAGGLVAVARRRRKRRQS